MFFRKGLEKVMGGRGASSGISVSGNTYGIQYEALSKSGNVKFVKK